NPVSRFPLAASAPVGHAVPHAPRIGLRMTSDQPPKSRPGRSVRSAPGLLRRVLRAMRAVLLAVLAIWAAMLVAYRWIDPPATPLMLIRLVEEGRLDYRPRTLDQIARTLPNSAIAAEDNNFCSH